MKKGCNVKMTDLEPTVMAQRIYDAAEKLNYPSGHRVYLYLKANNQYVPYKVIQEVYNKEDAVRQLFYRERNIRRPRHKGPTMLAKPNLRQGRFSAADIDDRWMADLADLTAQPSGEFQYILAVLNVFSKQLWAKPLTTKTPEAVTAAFRDILQGKEPPTRLDTDSGAEFTGPFQQLLEEKDIFHVTKDPQDTNALAPLDRAIQTQAVHVPASCWRRGSRLGRESPEDRRWLQRDCPQRPPRQSSRGGPRRQAPAV